MSNMNDVLSASIPLEYERRKNQTAAGVDYPVANNISFSYGTAGFRSKAEELTFIAFRIGYVASLRARQLNKCIGIMITASHNAACDNGIKVVDPMGEMLSSEWEKLATELVNEPDDSFLAYVNELENKTMAPKVYAARIVLAMDTRPTGLHLKKAIECGASFLNDRKVPVTCHGLLTTPQLSYITRCENDSSFGIPTADGYYTRLSKAFNELFKMTPGDEPIELVLDCANGVGALAMKNLLKYLDEDLLQIKLLNENGQLNFECGADFVKQTQMIPASFDNISSTTKCAALDGDADRLIYFSRADNSSDANLIDGDKIAALFTKFFKEQLENAEIIDKLSLGVVQTAYSNGASTRYFKNVLKVKPDFVPTGVKHLHHVSCQYDVGIYFESNGHGTVTFSQKFKNLIRENETNEVFKRLQLISNVINEIVGDGIADLLAVELILRHYKWTFKDWQDNLFSNVPNINVKVPVSDRSIFKTTWSETKVVEPANLQEQIEDIVKNSNGIRSFVRPSGTENIVRVYAESTTPEATKSLGEAVAQLIRQFSFI